MSVTLYRILRPIIRIGLLFAVVVPLVVEAAPPPKPGNFRFLTYSSTAAELFWERSVGEIFVVGYELSLNGEVLGIFDTLSYFDDNLVAGLDYEFSIAAVDRSGQRSNIASLVVRTPASPFERIELLEQEIANLKAQLNRTIPAPVPVTGQKISYLDGDDGDWQTGASPPVPRFTANINDTDDINENGGCDAGESCNGTFTDHMTGLVWLSVRDCIIRRSWTDAVSSTNMLAGDGTTCGDLSDGSQPGDWRVPNVRELHSLIDLSWMLPALAQNLPFTGTWDGYPWREYWSSTTLSVDDGVAWAIILDFGHVTTSLKSDEHRVWAVRDGQS